MEKGIYLPDIAVYISYKRNHLTCDYYTVLYKMYMFVHRFCFMAYILY